MKRHGLALCTLPVMLAASACSKGGGAADAASCPAFEMKVDGQPVTGFTTRLAFTHKRKDERMHQVHWFNHDKITCEQVTSTGGRAVPEGEVEVAAFTGGTGLISSGVASAAHTQGGIAVALVSPAPEKAGDKVAVCIPESTFTPKIGELKDKTVTIKGLMEGSWCGFMDWDAR